MRTKAVLSCLLAAIMLMTPVLMVSTAKVDAHAVPEPTYEQSTEGHLHHAGHHEPSDMPRSEEPGHQHQHNAPGGPCTSICCAAGMACCVALVAVFFDVRPLYDRIRLHAPFDEVLAGIEPSVPLRPPRATA